MTTTSIVEKQPMLAEAADQPAALEMVSMFQRLACDPNASVEKIERLMALWERSEAKKAESAFNAAMSSAQSEMLPVAADADNPQTRSRYASYEALDRALRPIYTKHQFGLSFDTGDAPGADVVRIVCYVTHSGGHARTYHADMPADGKGAKGGDVMTKTHAVGSAMSYGMRYLLKMIFNVAVGEDDDDGNAAARTAPKQVEPDGYVAWLGVLDGLAAGGLQGLNGAWNQSKREFRDYITKHDPQKWQMLKAKASRAAK